VSHTQQSSAKAESCLFVALFAENVVHDLALSVSITN
jgi:hypothetical protein